MGVPYKPESVKYVEFEQALKNHSLSKYNYDFDADRTDVSVFCLRPISLNFRHIRRDNVQMVLFSAFNPLSKRSY